LIRSLLALITDVKRRPSRLGALRSRHTGDTTARSGVKDRVKVDHLQDSCRELGVHLVLCRARKMAANVSTPLA